jgi:hypothetical protein
LGRLIGANGRAKRRKGRNAAERAESALSAPRSRPPSTGDREDYVEGAMGMKLRFVAAASAAFVLIGGGAALAHHSGAMFDRAKEVSFSGTIKEFQYVNPHSWIEVLVPDGAGEKTVQWSFETEGPNRLQRVGWTRYTLRPGDKVTVRGHPLKDGRPGGSLIDITTADGKTWACGKGC